MFVKTITDKPWGKKNLKGNTLEVYHAAGLLFCVWS